MQENNLILTCVKQMHNSFLYQRLQIQFLIFVLMQYFCLTSFSKIIDTNVEKFPGIS